MAGKSWFIYKWDITGITNENKSFKSLSFSSREPQNKEREKNFSFGTSLNPVEFPPITAPWSTHENMYPAVSSTSFKEYATRKREGSLGQQQKAYSMLTSRKIVSVKTHQSSESIIFIRALIKKSYGEQIRLAVLLFESLVPSKGYCECCECWC